MARLQRGFPRGGRSGSRRQTGWSEGPATGGDPGSCQAISGSGTALAVAGITPTIEGTTLARIRGMLSFQLTTSSASTAGFDGAFGIAIADSEAFAVGVTALPDPQDDAADEVWIYHTFFQVKSTTSVTADLGADIMASQRFTVDSKAMPSIVGVMPATASAVPEPEIA